MARRAFPRARTYIFCGFEYAETDKIYGKPVKTEVFDKLKRSHRLFKYL